MKDNDQSANLAALVEAGVRSFKIEGRYKDLGYVKNITAHYRLLLDEVLAARPGLARASSGRCTYTFNPNPRRTYNRGTRAGAYGRPRAWRSSRTYASARRSHATPTSRGSGCAPSAAPLAFYRTRPPMQPPSR